MSRYEADTVHATAPVEAHPVDDEQYGADFTRRLPSGVTITSATLTQKLTDGTATTDLTLGAAAPNAATFTGRRGQTVAIGKGVLFTASGGTAWTDYLITVKATCSDTRVRNLVCRFEVRDGTDEPEEA